MKIVCDIECDALKNPQHIWLVVCKNVDTGEIHSWRDVSHDDGARTSFLKFVPQVKMWVGHNWLGYDLPVLCSLVDPNLKSLVTKSIDTLIISKLIDYSRDGHSLEDYGIELGLNKIDYTDFTRYSKELETYCIRDVALTEKVYNQQLGYILNPKNKKAIETEHLFQFKAVNSLEKNGFYFDVPKAEKYLSEVTKQLAILDNDILTEFPPREVLIREFTPKATKYGTISKTSIPRSLWEHISEYEVGKTYRHTRLEPFNPASHKQIIEILNEAGWSPVDKTKTHIETERELNRLKYRNKRDAELDLRLKKLDTDYSRLKIYGWRVNENNLSTLPDWEEILKGNKCLLQIKTDSKNTLVNIIRKTQREKGLQLCDTIMKISDIIKVNSSNEITELLSKTLSECLPNRTDVAKFVEEESCSWSIIAIPQGVFVDFSASYVTDISDGTKDIKKALKSTLVNLPSTAPSPARALAKRILFEARRRTLTEWLALVQDDGRIHGKFYGIGSWPHRMAHQAPNTANIPNPTDISGKVKLLGKEMRGLWRAPKGRLLVGVDAEGIQLRIFAHLINDPEFTKALVEGKKEDKSDPHSLNQRILGPVCKSRAAAKRFIYAMLLGAGLDKLAEILEASRRETEFALEGLVERYTGFATLKRTIIPADAERGWFVGLDGRPIRIPGETAGQRKHLAMSGRLQSGEVIVMKMATLKFIDRLEEYESFLVNLVHDEWQAETPNNMEIALRVAQIMSDSLRVVGEELKLNCPLAGSYYNDDIKDYTIGTNWSQTH